jgi:VanZ family protein
LAAAVPERSGHAGTAPALNVRPEAWRGLFWAAVVAGVVLALWPVQPHEEQWFAHVDKLKHVVAFAVLAIVGTRAGFRAWPMLALGLLALGAAIEVLQGFTPTRTAGIGDWLADAAGIACGLFVDRARRSRSRPQP